MDSYESLLEKHALTGIYVLKEDSAVCAELYAYAAALDTVCAELDEMYRENFITTALSYGLSHREMIISGLISDGISAEQRRSILLERYSGTGGFTPGALERLLSSFGVQCTVTENPQQQRVVIDVDVSGMPETAVNLFVRSVLDFMPAHIETEVVYSGRRWSEIDGDDLTFAQFDAENHTWAELDALE